MLSKNDGYFLLELLLSLSAWFMMGTFFIPLLMDISNQSRQLVQDKKAKQFLFEELQANLVEDRTNSKYSIFHNGTEYKIYWAQSTVNGQKEVCVEVDGNTYLPRTKLCKLPE
jgi:competence protein ComGE